MALGKEMLERLIKDGWFIETGIKYESPGRNPYEDLKLKHIKVNEKFIISPLTIKDGEKRGSADLTYLVFSKSGLCSATGRIICQHRDRNCKIIEEEFDSDQPVIRISQSQSKEEK